MRQVTVTEKYRAVNEGQMAKQEFVRQMRLAFPQHINQFNGYDDSVSILRTKGLLFEEKTMKHDVSDESIRRALDTELTVLGHDPVTCKDSEVIEKAKAKAIANLSKDPLYYYNLLSNESSKVDKNDKMKETKRGALEKDTFNDMKNATLKEAKLVNEGTRALVGYLAGDRLTTAYNHYDGYPSHLGKALQMHYNDDEAAKDLALKGYISFMDLETGEVESKHKEPAGKINLSDNDEDMAREIADEINSMGADYGYIWDDRANGWVTIKNTGTRSMIDQITSKMGDYAEVQEADLDETEEEYLAKKDAAIKKAMGDDVEEVIEIPTLKETLGGIVALLKSKGAGSEAIKDFIKTHKDDIQGMDMDQVEDEFEQFLSVNTDYIDEKKGKDHDGDGDIDGDDYMAAKDKAIKKAMGKGEERPSKFKKAGERSGFDMRGIKEAGKDKVVKEAVKSIIQKVLEEQVINEAATNDLAKIASEYDGFEGLKPAVVALENIVTEIESFYDKTRSKIQKIYNDLGEVRNDEGLKVGAFITPAIENAFKRDLRPIIKNQFHGGLEMPKVKRISQDDIDRGYVQQEAPKQTVYTPIQENKKK